MEHRFELCDRQEGVSEWSHRANGLVVLTWPTPVAPVVGFGVVYRVGSRHEGTGHTGATHILEHLMFKGTRRFNRERGTEIARLLHRVGAGFNATTWLDRTNYYEVLPVEELPLAVDIESDRIRGALVRDSDLASERTVVLNELEMGENDPFELLLKESFAHAYLEHPYHHPTIGWRGDVERVTAETIRRFYDTYYHPDNATVLVVGDMDEEKALAEVERGFGGLPPATAAFPEPTNRESEQRGERRFQVHRAGEVGCLALNWHIPNALHPDLAGLDVLVQILADGVTSRLEQRLVESNRCLGIHAGALALHDPGLFQILATLAPGVEHLEVEEAVREEVARLRREPPSAEEVARAKAQTRTDLAFQRESPGRIMAGLTEAVAAGDWRLFLRELEEVSAVTADDLVRVADAYLDDRRLTAGWFVPEGPTRGGAPVTTSGPQPCYLHRPFAERVGVRSLPGGARLVVLPNAHAPTVTMAGTVAAGLAHSGDGRFTVPALTAAMLERGTAAADRLELARELEDHGLQVGIRASAGNPTVVSFSGQGLAEELPRLARLMVDMLRRPTFPPDELEKLRTRVLGALRREREDTHALAYAALTRHLYPAGHPLHQRPIAAREGEVAALTAQDLTAFHGVHYGPDGMVLAVVGDVHVGAVEELLGGLLEGWSAGPTAPADWPLAETAAPPTEERVEVEDRPNLDVFLGHRGMLTREQPDYGATLLANSCLGQSTLTSRLGMAVRDGEGLTYGIYSRFFGTLRIPGPWATFLTVSAANLDRAVAVCRSVIDTYVVEGPRPEELAQERTAQAGAYRVGLATNSGVARELVAALTAGQTVDHLDLFPERLQAVSRDEVMAAIGRHLHPDRLVLTAAGTF